MPRRLPKRRKLLIGYRQAKAYRPLTTSMGTLPRGSQNAMVDPIIGYPIIASSVLATQPAACGDAFNSLE
jgi:hypothetical protein